MKKISIQQTDGNFNDYLAHLFNSETLQEITCSFGFLNPNIQRRANNNLTSLGILNMRPLAINYRQFTEWFPNVSTLAIKSPLSEANEREALRNTIDVSPINSWSLIKLELSFVTDRVLSQINLPNLKELKITNCYQGRNFSNERIWENFFRRHRQLERVDFYFDHHHWYLAIIVDNLPALKHLSFEVFVSEPDFEIDPIDTVDGCYWRLKSFDISVRVPGMCFYRAKNYAKNLKGLSGLEVSDDSDDTLFFTKK
jgi:hypothetical protein